MERMSPRQHESSTSIESESESGMVAMIACLSMMLGKRRSENVSVVAEVHFPSILTERSSLSWKRRGRKVARPVSNKGLKSYGFIDSGGIGVTCFWCQRKLAQPMETDMWYRISMFYNHCSESPQRL